MNLDLDSTQTLLRDSVREYLEAELPFDRVRACERDHCWDETLWKGVLEQGWLALPFAEAHGGAGGSLVDAGLLLEEFARRAAVVPLAETLACTLVLAEAGADAETHVSALLEGRAVPVPALLDPSDALDRVDLELGADGTLTGEKLFVDYGAPATHHLVAARDADGDGLFLVDAAESVCCEPLHTIGRTPSSRAHYERASAARVGGADALARLRMLGRTFAAVQCLGSAQQALDMTVEYARVREAFGRPIGTFQAVQHHGANMAIQVASSRFLVYETLHSLGHGAATARQVALAKASASRMVPDVTLLAHQIHGGNGIIEENDLYFFTLRGKDRSLAWGSAEECLVEAAAEVDDEREWLC
jgi:alkylation response protein AidB-like acyl-CoA dehydrogenase